MIITYLKVLIKCLIDEKRLKKFSLMKIKLEPIIFQLELQSNVQFFEPHKTILGCIFRYFVLLLQFAYIEIFLLSINIFHKNSEKSKKFIFN